MRLRVKAIVVVALAVACTLPMWGSSADAARGPVSLTPGRGVLYTVHKALWFRDLTTGISRHVLTPWPVEYLSPSPDGTLVAVQDKAGRLAVVTLATGRVRVVSARKFPPCCSDLTSAWSPNSQYLALVTPPATIDHGRLALWRRADGAIRTVVKDAALIFETEAWSHDSRSLLLSRGVVNSTTYPVKNPTLTVLDVARGTLRSLGKGTDATWSPDDRLVGYVSFRNCGASTCYGDEMVQPIGGGPAVRLIKNTMDDFLSLQWAPHAGGYLYDRWLLDATGHPARTVVPLNERVNAWAPDGSRGVVQNVHPYVAGPFRLSILGLDGTRRSILSTASSDDCGACSRIWLQTFWNHAGTSFTTMVPGIYTRQGKRVTGAVYVSSGAGTAVRVPVSISENADTNFLGFAAGDRAVLFQVDRILYRYDVASRAVRVLARKADLSTATLVP